MRAVVGAATSCWRSSPSCSIPAGRRHGCLKFSSRQHKFTNHVHHSPGLRDVAAAAIETVEFDADDEANTYIDEYTGHRRSGGGYTPAEFITFSEIPLRHELVMQVDAPVSKCYKIWADRFNWLQWFDMIEEVGFHEEDPALVSMYLWYRWATTPFLELFTTLRRTVDEENKHILEEPVDGAPLVAAVLFEEGERGGGSTTVKLRISYLLPDVLHDFAGKLAVWSDVDRKLQSSMERMRAFVEEVDMEELEALRKEDWQTVQDGFPEDRRLREEDKQAEAERVERIQQEMAAAAAAELGVPYQSGGGPVENREGSAAALQEQTPIEDAPAMKGVHGEGTGTAEGVATVKGGKKGSRGKAKRKGTDEGATERDLE